MVVNKNQLIQTNLEPKDFGQYRSVIPISWRLHKYKELENCLYDRYIDEYGAYSISITYCCRLIKSQNLDEIEDLFSPPKWAFEREKLKYLDRLNREEPSKTLSIEKVVTQNDVGILLKRVTEENIYSYEFREWFRYFTSPLAQILIVVIGPDSQKEVESWRGWFINKIIKNTYVDWDPMNSLGPFLPI